MQRNGGANIGIVVKNGRNQQYICRGNKKKSENVIYIWTKFVSMQVMPHISCHGKTLKNNLLDEFSFEIFVKI